MQASCIPSFSFPANRTLRRCPPGCAALPGFSGDTGAMAAVSAGPAQTKRENSRMAFGRSLFYP